jgi:hypothetical protein
MKKLLLTIILAFLTCTLFAQNKKIEYDDLYYTPSKDAKSAKHVKQKSVIVEDTLLFDAYNAVDTLVKENPDIQVNYVYNDDPFFYSNHLGMFYHGGFNYWHYNPFFYDPWYDDFGWGWNPYYGYNYPYWNYPYYNNFYFGWNSYWGWNFGWNWYHPYYYHNNYWHGHNGFYDQHNNYYSHNGINQQPQYGRRERPSNFTTHQIDNRRTQPQERKITGRDPNNRPIYNNERRTYTPAYEKPRMSERPPYNNSRVNLIRENTNRYQTNTARPDVRTQQYRNTENRKGNIQSSTQSRTYSPPSRSSTYSQPSRSYNSGSADRRSSSSSNFSSGSSNRGFGGSNSSRTSGTRR